MLKALREEITRLADEKRAIHLMAYFKTGKGGYGADDTFVGLTVPQSRQIAKQFSKLELSDIEQLLLSAIHEERLIALFILTLQFEKANEATQERYYTFYLSHTSGVNNWDLVDASAHKIVGEFIYTHQDKLPTLFHLAKSQNLWEKRIAIIATFAFLKRKDAKPSLTIAEILLYDKHDLIHKAVGWTLREVGKHVGRETLQIFLRAHYKTMPRTALRYAIEHFPEAQRKKYLQGLQ